MHKLRDLVVLSVAAAGFAASLLMFRRAVGIGSPWFGLVVMLSALGLIALARPFFLLRRPAAVRRNRAWEVRGGLYQAAGVRLFGTVLRRTPLRYLNQFVYLAGSATPSMVRAQAESAEAAHLVAGALLIPHMVYACVQKWWGTLAWLTMVQALGNLYPILHLRWVRARIDRFHGRRRSRTPGAA